MNSGAGLVKAPSRRVLRPIGLSALPQRSFTSNHSRLASQATASIEPTDTSQSSDKAQSTSTETPQLSPAAQRKADLMSALSGPSHRIRSPQKASKRDASETIDALLASRGIKNSSTPHADKQGSILKGMLSGRFDPTPMDFSKYTRTANVETLQAPLRLDAFVGRSVPVSGNVGLARAIKMLDIKNAVNKVRVEARQQARYERPGLKRKRLRSERWRARFREGFKATMAKVARMRKQGW